MLNYTEPKFSPSQQRILDVFYKHGNRVYSWQLNQEAFTADYRRRIFELRKMGYVIKRFTEPGRITAVRRGYYLIPPSKQENHDPKTAT